MPGKNKLQEKMWTRNFILIVLINMLVFLSFQMITPCLPLYVQKIGATEKMIGLIAGIFTITAVSVRPFIGRFLDTRGRRGIYLCGIIIIFIAIFLYPLAASFAVFLAVRLFHGLGWSATTTAAGTIATDAVPKSRLAEGMGYFGLTPVLAMAVAPTFGLTVMNHFNFAVVCYTSLSLAFLAMLIAFFLREQKIEPAQGEKDKSLFEKRSILPSLMMFLVGLSYGAVISFIAIYAEEFGIGNIGPFYTSFAVCVLLSRLFAGRLVDRRGPDIVMIPGLALFIAAMLLLSQADKLNSFIIAGCVYGLGYGIVQPTLQALAVKNVEPQRRGAANSTLMCGFDSGIGLGAVIWGVVADATSLGTMFGANVLPVIAAFILYGYYRKNAIEKAQTKTVSRS